LGIEKADGPSAGDDGGATPTRAAPATRLLHPGEGGYDEALAEWDLQQNPLSAHQATKIIGEVLAELD